MKKLIFVDSDGTLKNNQGIISEYTKDVVTKLQQKGIEVVITTGRPRYHAQKVKEESNASRYIISSNGAEIYDSLDKKVIYAQYIGNRDVLRVYKIVKKYDARFIMTVDEKEVVTDIVKNANQIVLNGKIRHFLKNNKVKQIFIRSDTQESINKTYNAIQKLKNVGIVNESSYFQTGIEEEKGLWFSVGNSSNNKGEAIKALCTYLNVNFEDTYGFGNDYNDIEMFNTVNYSIVMDNANEDLKKKAKIVAPSNDKDGVATLLETLFLNNTKEK